MKMPTNIDDSVFVVQYLCNCVGFQFVKFDSVGHCMADIFFV